MPEKIKMVYNLIGIVTFLFFLTGGVYTLLAHVRNDNAHFVGHEKAGLMTYQEKDECLHHVRNDDIIQAEVNYSQLITKVQSLEKTINELKIEQKELSRRLDYYLKKNGG